MAKNEKKTRKSSPNKQGKKSTFKKVSPEQYKAMNFFERRKYKHHLNAEKRARQHAEMLSTLPKEQPARFLAHFKPKRVFHYWFSAYGLNKFLKILAACFLLLIILIGGLFVYYKKSLEDIQLSNLSITETVNTYLDRNGIVLWEDTGNENYRLVVDGSEISTDMRRATVAIEDKNFYNHPGIDLSALIRATFSTLSGRGVQGGSTLTQQLIKQVYFSDEAASANRGGITRKIKELILALELEKMYDKEQIITMYLNESPYGGRRNGVESAAQTYFGKSAKDLNLAESALLAGIPNNPAVLNPSHEYGNEALIERQHKVLDAMRELYPEEYSEEDIQAAKDYDILATIEPESSQYANILAPHFVLEVKSQLEEKYGYSAMRSGGFTITTTLDYRAQELAEAAVAAGLDTSKSTNRADNGALVSLDVETSQVIAMVGSADFYQTGYGEVNVTTSLLEPGSTIKPVLDYAPLFQQREGQNFGPGSVLRDENIDSLYCSGYTGGSCMMRNFNGRFNGDVTIRQSLANSLNIPAVKALYINGIENSLETLHALGDVSYCSDASGGLSIAIGSGCNIRPVEHANTYASLARGGAYKDIAYILEVKDSNGNIIESWSDSQPTQVVDEQVAYMISSILSDSNARYLTMGSLGTSYGFVVPGVWTAMKTGTTTTVDSSVAKDSWMVSYSTAVVTLAWSGNHDGSGLASSSNSPVARMIANYMEPVHKQVYAAEGKWTSGDQPVKPAGIQTLTVNGRTDIWPSWYNNKTSGVENVTLEFNKYTKKLASTCTIDEYKVTINATKTIDPMTRKEIYSVPSGYDKDTTDDCSYVYVGPSVNVSVSDSKIAITVTKGSENLDSYTLYIDGEAKESGKIPSTSFKANYEPTGSEKSIKVVVTDSYGSEASDSV